MTSSRDFVHLRQGVHVTLSLGTLGMTFDTVFKIFFSRKMISGLSGGSFSKEIHYQLFSCPQWYLILCTPFPFSPEMVQMNMFEPIWISKWRTVRRFGRYICEWILSEIKSCLWGVVRHSVQRSVRWPRSRTSSLRRCSISHCRIWFFT